MSASTIDCATTAEQRVRELRRDGIGRVMRRLYAGQPLAARELLLLSVEQQARVSGIDVLLPRRDDIDV